MVVVGGSTNKTKHYPYLPLMEALDPRSPGTGCRGQLRVSGVCRKTTFPSALCCNLYTLSRVSDSAALAVRWVLVP